MTLRHRVESLVAMYSGPDLKNRDVLYGGFVLAMAAARLSIENSRRLEALIADSKKPPQPQRTAT